MDDHDPAARPIASIDEQQDDTELSDDDLEHVVGGLERARVDHGGPVSADHYRPWDTRPAGLTF